MNSKVMKSQEFCQRLGIEIPVICGAMYPCSNPELVAAVSNAGGLGVVQPLSLTYVHGYDFREGIRYIKSLTARPIAVNLLIEQSSQIYMERMRRFLEISLEEGVGIFVTALGNPSWVVKAAHQKGGFVLHDVTEKRWAQKAVDAGVDGLICVNRLAGGHAGTLEPERLFEELADFKLPLVCAGGVGSPLRAKKMLELGYVAVQMGTRFLASQECKISSEYKDAIVKAGADDIVLTEKLTGVPVAVIANEYFQKTGSSVGGVVSFLLKHPSFKHWMRLFYSLKSFYGFRKNVSAKNSKDYYWQAGKSVADIESVKSVAEIMGEFKKILLPNV